MKIATLFLLIAGMMAAVSGQNVSGLSEKSSLAGTVFDQYGAAIPQTKVSFTAKNGRVFSALTNQEGVYQIAINEGIYIIEFFQTGFMHYKIENYNISFTTTMRLDVSLIVGATIDTIPIRSKTKKRSAN